MPGILSLDTAFARIVGDVGNPFTYPFAARVAVVAGADSTLVVGDGEFDGVLLQTFIDAAVTLEAPGALALVHSAGFSSPRESGSPLPCP
jgi:hypothetical protein